jgi:hypothetical protein
MDSWLPMSTSVNPTKLSAQLSEYAVDLSIAQWRSKTYSTGADEKQ